MKRTYFWRKLVMCNYQSQFSFFNMNSTYIPSDRKLISTRALRLQKQLSFNDTSDFYI